MANEEQLLELLRENQELMKATFRSAEKTRKYILWTGIITIITFVLPLVALMIYLPSFIDTYTQSLGGGFTL
jgi:TRAP-type mannitol/chloroaromatic compound transport system permease small subunit